MIDDSAPSRERLAEVVDSLGGDEFQGAMIAYLSKLFGNLNGLAIRYHQTAQPEMQVNQVLDERVQDIYLNGLYRLDPLNNIPRADFSGGVYSFRKSFETDGNSIKYQEEVFRRARISDELAWVVILPDSSMQAYCLDKPHGQFSASELDLARYELPVVKSLAVKHFSLEFLGKLKDRSDSSQVDRIVHLTSNQVTESSRWRPELSLLANADKLLVEHEALAVRRNGGGFREKKLQCEGSLTSCIVSLDREDYLLQRIFPRSELSDKDYRGVIGKALGSFKLTEREGDVAYLSLLGYPNALIAKKLAISSGTVKNHKYSIYNKLDITTEREMFNMVLKNIISLTSSASSL